VSAKISALSSHYSFCENTLQLPLHDFVFRRFISEQYSEILRTEWVKVFNRIFDEDNYTAITVETLEEYQRITDVYPFKDASLEQVTVYIIRIFMWFFQKVCKVVTSSFIRKEQ
jgi:hypothetical protein